MSGYALLFPGQASQSVGMGSDIAGRWPAAAAAYRLADEITGLPISRLCFEGPADELLRTKNLQPCLLATSLATLAAAAEEAALPDPASACIAGATQPPALMAGHSVGQYAALVAAGSIRIDEALDLVAVRARAMERAGTERPGTMAALIGGDLAGAEDLCRLSRGEEPGSYLSVANINAPGQTVIAGDHNSISRAAKQARALGFRRAIELPVSAAFHSTAMKPAQSVLAERIAQQQFANPSIPVISNLTAAPFASARQVWEELPRQVVDPVQWSASMDALVAEGLTSAFEVGPGNVLSAILRRIGPEITVSPVGDRDGVLALAAQLELNRNV